MTRLGYFGSESNPLSNASIKLELRKGIVSDDMVTMQWSVFQYVAVRSK